MSHIMTVQFFRSYDKVSWKLNITNNEIFVPYSAVLNLIILP